MNKEDLIKELNNLSALRENRLRVANLVLDDQETFLPLLKIALAYDNKISIKAAWILEFVCIQKLEWLFQYLDVFSESLKFIHFDSAIRPFSKICMLLATKFNSDKELFNKNKENIMQIVEVEFDWLISDQKVAVKAYTMEALYFFGNHIDWIHPELKAILLKNHSKESAAYIARAKKILKWLG
jgi:hypothetical protein